MDVTCQAEDLDSLIADSLSGVQAALDGDRKVLGGRCGAHRRIHGTDIFAYIYIPDKSLPNVGIHIPYMQYMDPMGVDLLHLITFPETNSLPMNISARRSLVAVWICVACDGSIVCRL